MLSRRTCNDSATARRAKSSPSIRPRPQSSQFAGLEDEKVAHDYAVTAAELAFERAKERDIGVITESQKKGVRESANGNMSPALSRQKSIRFAGPSAVPQRNCSITRRNAPEYRLGLKAHGSAKASEDRSTNAEQSAARALAMASPQESEQFNEHDFASQPSSYRKLQKAKSMFTPDKTPSAVFPSGVPMAGRHFQRQSVRSSDSWGESIQLPDPRLRKSFSFLRGVADRLPTNDRQYAARDEAVQLARDQYLRELEQQRLKEQPSLFKVVKRHRSQKVFRRSVRTTSINSSGSAIESLRNSAGPLKPSLIGQRARSFSSTVKNSLKRVFRRSINAEDSMPAQHLDARRAHYGDDDSTFGQLRQHYRPIPSPDAELLRRVESRESNLPSLPVSVEELPCARSILKVPSEDDLSMDKSRVTSWTNSTAANTVNIAPLVERKRLSVIKEDGGPYQPSSSATQFHDPGNRYAAFCQPFRQAVAGALPEPQRVFSALQREIVKKSSHPDLDDTNSVTDSTLEQATIQRPKGALQRSLSSEIIRSKPFFLPSGHLDYTEATVDLTPQQIAMLNESGATIPKGPLNELGSVFSHSSPHNEQKECSSRYGGAMQSTSEDDVGWGKMVPLRHQSQLSGPLRSKAAQYNAGGGVRSESVYSRTSGGHTPKAAGSSVSLTKSEVSEEPCTTFISTTKTERRNQAKFSTPRRAISDKSSKSCEEWKKRSVFSLSYCEDRLPEDDNMYTDLPIEESGHKRENAQIDGDDVAIGRLQRASHSPSQPLGSLQITAYPYSNMQQKASNPISEDHQHLDVSLAPGQANVPQEENSPPSQRSSQAQLSTRPGRGKDLYGAQISSVGLSQSYPQAPLLIRDGNRNSPTSLNNRHSPERADRIRRLKSKGSFLLHKAGSSPNLAAEGCLTDSRAVSTAINAHPSNSWLRESHPKENVPRPSQKTPSAADKKQIVEKFLKGRRREMRISEESNGDPAFL